VDLRNGVAPRASDAVDRALLLFGRDRLADDAWMETYLARSVASPPDPEVVSGLLGLQAASTEYDDRLAALAAVRCPCLVVGFEEDLLVPAALAREVAGAIPAAEYVEIQRCGHSGPLEQPEFVNAAVLEFLARHR
jgi:pimeloyl-ACP methyl ester carboxylesterase